MDLSQNTFRELIETALDNAGIPYPAEITLNSGETDLAARLQLYHGITDALKQFTWPDSEEMKWGLLLGMIVSLSGYIVQQGLDPAKILELTISAEDSDKELFEYLHSGN